MIFVAEVKKENTTASGLILSSDIESGAKPAKVLAVGPEVKDIKVDDKIAVKWAEALPVTVDGSQRALVSEEHVYGIFD